MHYLDNAATTKPCAAAVAAASRCLNENFGNPSSLHALGNAARAALEQARAEIAFALSVKTEEIIFTAGGAEACNLALFGLAKHLRWRGRHIVTSALEHPAVSETLKAMDENGYELTVVPPDREGRITPEAVARALRPDTALISIMMISNETGAVNPVADIVEAARDAGCDAIIHTDAIQALCKIPCKPRELGVDLMTISAHKIGGVKGAGALWRAPGVHLTPIVRGGGQEQGLRSGTEALPAIAAFGAACRARHDTQSRDVEHMRALKENLLSGLNAMDGVAIIPPHDAPHIVSLAVPGYPSEVLLRFLSDRSVYLSHGSACHRGRRSKSLAAMGLSARMLDSVLRVSLSPENIQADVDALMAALRAGMDTLIGN